MSASSGTRAADAGRAESELTLKAAAEMTGSTGKVQSIKPYTRGVPAKAVSTSRKGVFAPTTAPHKGTPHRKVLPRAPAAAVDSGTGLMPRTRPVTQEDKLHGGKSALLPGYCKGGRVPMR